MKFHRVKRRPPHSTWLVSCFALPFGKANNVHDIGMLTGHSKLVMLTTPSWLSDSLSEGLCGFRETNTAGSHSTMHVCLASVHPSSPDHSAVTTLSSSWSSTLGPGKLLLWFQFRANMSAYPKSSQGSARKRTKVSNKINAPLGLAFLWGLAASYVICQLARVQGLISQALIESRRIRR